ncbi:hypothetical protein Tco_1120555 [Tanacetum coccineum]
MKKNLHTSAMPSAPVCRCMWYDGPDPTRHIPKGTIEGYLNVLTSFGVQWKGRSNGRHVRMEGTFKLAPSVGPVIRSTKAKSDGSLVEGPTGHDVEIKKIVGDGI